MIRTVDLSLEPHIEPYMSYTLHERIVATLARGERVLLFLNRRGLSSAYVCRDCSYRWTCSNCDVSLIVHARPRSCLVCHQCSETFDIPLECPQCHGTRLTGVGIGVQGIEVSLGRLFPDISILRIDSDSRQNKKKNTDDDRTSASIIIGTEMVDTLPIPSLGLVGCILLESEMAVPEYDIEERIYTHILTHIRRWVDTVLQTYIPESPLVQSLVSGNFRDFFRRTVEERQTFRYPPFVEMAVLRVRDKNVSKVDDTIARLVAKLEDACTDDTFIVYDREIHERRGGEYIKKILLRGPDLMGVLDTVAYEIFHNRHISVEWK